MHHPSHSRVLRVVAGAAIAAASFGALAQGVTSAQAERAKQASQIESRERENFGRSQVHKRETLKARKAEQKGDLGAGPIGARTQTVREPETAGDKATTNVQGTAGTR